MSTNCKLIENGPLEVSGDFEILDTKGIKIESEKTVYLCRCGSSKNKPFCDGSHKSTGFSG